MISAAWYVPPWSPLPSTREDLVYVYVVFGRQPRGSSHLHPCALQGQRRSRNQPQPARAAGLWLQHACQCGNRGKNEALWCPGPRQPLWVQEPRLVTLVSGWERPAAEPVGAVEERGAAWGCLDRYISCTCCRYISPIILVQEDATTCLSITEPRNKAQCHPFLLLQPPPCKTGTEMLPRAKQWKEKNHARNKPTQRCRNSFFVLQGSKKHSRTGSGPLVLHEQPLCFPPSLRPGTECPHAACQLPSGFPPALGSSPTTATPKDRSRNTAFPSSLRNQRTSSSAGTSRSLPTATPYISGDLLQARRFWAPRGGFAATGHSRQQPSPQMQAPNLLLPPSNSYNDPEPSMIQLCKPRLCVANSASRGARPAEAAPCPCTSAPRTAQHPGGGSSPRPHSFSNAETLTALKSLGC